jgi:hypothetical protein
MTRDTIQRIGEKFDEELDEIQRKRFGDIDKGLSRPISKERITDAIPIFPEWKTLKEKLLTMPKKEDLR